MNPEGVIEDPNMAEAHYYISIIKGELMRGQEPDTENMKDADVLISLIETVDIDWKKYAEILHDISELPPDEAQKRLEESVKNIINNGGLDQEQINVF